MQLNVVVVDMWDKDWTMALCSSSLMFWLWAACTLSLCLGFCLRAGGLTVSHNVERISGALCPVHDSSNLHFIQVTAPDIDVVNEVPVFGPGMHPRCPVHVTELEESVCDGKTLFRAQREQPETATIHVSNTMMTNDSMPYVEISVYPGIEISQQYDFVILQNSSEGGIQRVIKAIFHIIR